MMLLRHLASYTVYMKTVEFIKHKFTPIARLINLPKKHNLLIEGNLCSQVFLIEHGYIRSWFNDDGKDVTFQFFSPGDIVTSFESLKNNLPSLYNIETLSSVSIWVINYKDVLRLLEKDPELNKFVDDYIARRLYHYQSLFISRIKNSPQKRYEELLEKQPEIFDHIPNQYIASFLGITPVSLSRIKSKNY